MSKHTCRQLRVQTSNETIYRQIRHLRGNHTFGHFGNSQTLIIGPRVDRECETEEDV